jgi:ribosomal protein L40E
MDYECDACHTKNFRLEYEEAGNALAYNLVTICLSCGARCMVARVEAWNI